MRTASLLSYKIEFAENPFPTADQTTENPICPPYRQQPFVLIEKRIPSFIYTHIREHTVPEYSASIVKIAARAPFARQNRATVPEERASPYSGKNSMLKYSRHTKV